MTYRDREKLRKMTIAKNRRTRDMSTADTYWLTLVKKKTTCCKCGGILMKNKKMIYLPKQRECICTFCAEKESISYGLSFSYEIRTRRERNKRT